LTIAFYLENADLNFEKARSVIRFGGMDREGLKDSSGNSKTILRTIRTKNKTTWDMDLDYT